MGVFEIYCDRCGLPFRKLYLPFELPKKVQSVLEKGILQIGNKKTYVSKYDSYGSFTETKTKRQIDATGVINGRGHIATHTSCEKYFKVLNKDSRKILEEYIQGQVFHDKKYVSSRLFFYQFKFENSPSVFQKLLQFQSKLPSYQQVDKYNVSVISRNEKTKEKLNKLLLQYKKK